MKDYYYILGINKNASKEDIKKAYRKLSLKFHPDQNNGDKFFEERFREINEAYEVLTDDENRKLYDFQVNQSLRNTDTNNYEYSNKEQQESQKTNSTTRNSTKEETRGKQERANPEYYPPPSETSPTSVDNKSFKGLRNFVLTVAGLLVLYIIKTIAEENIKADALRKYDVSLNQSQNSGIDTSTIAGNLFHVDSTFHALNHSKDGKKETSKNLSKKGNENINRHKQNAGTVDNSVTEKSQEEDYDGLFKTQQIEAKFPGGATEWQKYLERNLNSNIPVDNGAPPGNYTVIVSFLIDKSGNISEVKALNDPGYGTAEEAIRVIQDGPNWIPAVQYGRNVIYRQKQTITFQVSEQ